MTIRTYDVFGIDSSRMDEAIDEAAALLRRAGVETRWLPCGSVQQPARRVTADCRLPPDPRELVLRFTRSVEPARGVNVSLGNSLINGRTGAGVVATVYPDRVARIAARAGIDPHHLLGLAVAHEIGHLLLGSAEHSADGLMRERWSLIELQRDEDADRYFSPADVTTIRGRILRTIENR